MDVDQDDDATATHGPSSFKVFPPLSQSSPSIDAPETQRSHPAPAPASIRPPAPAKPPVAGRVSVTTRPRGQSPPAHPTPPTPSAPPAFNVDALADSIAQAVLRAVDELLPRGTTLPAASTPARGAAVPVAPESGLPVVRFASKNDPTSAPFTSAAARTMARLAKDVTSLGVPAGQRAHVRAQLLDLARTLDRDKVDWQTLRDAMSLSMDFPPLACRVMPVLIAFLEDAA